MGWGIRQDARHPAARTKRQNLSSIEISFLYVVDQKKGRDQGETDLSHDGPHDHLVGGVDPEVGTRVALVPAGAGMGTAAGVEVGTGLGGIPVPVAGVGGEAGEVAGEGVVGPADGIGTGKPLSLSNFLTPSSTCPMNSNCLSFSALTAERTSSSFFWGMDLR